MHVENASVESHRPLKGDFRVLTLRSPAIAAEVRPGQFVHVRVPRAGELTLRRPFSVFRAERGVLSILYKSVGKGTRAMESVREGDAVSLLGPLGHGFPSDAGDRHPILVAGGYGVAPLYLLATRLARRGELVVGGATAGSLLCTEDFEAAGWPVHAATEDGSLGFKGLATGLLEQRLSALPAGCGVELFACGPNGMLRAVGAIAQRIGARAWLSLDRNMGCGVGACLACVQKVAAEGPGPDGAPWRWARVCKDGPVFECRQILWDTAG